VSDLVRANQAAGVGAVQRLTHIGLCVRDMDRSLRFYQDALGFDWEHELRMDGKATDTLLRLRDAKLHAVYLTRDGVRIELLHFAGPPVDDRPSRVMNEPGLTHLSLRVADIDAVVAAVCAQGGRVLDDTMLRFPDAGTFVCFVTDPDGQLIELVQSPGDPAAPPRS
jgi:catechol 2,3-dioxygenase-like lactoylglutathione lyase family enzyme